MSKKLFKKSSNRVVYPFTPQGSIPSSVRRVEQTQALQLEQTIFDSKTLLSDLKKDLNNNMDKIDRIFDKVASLSGEGISREESAEMFENRLYRIFGKYVLDMLTDTDARTEERIMTCKGILHSLVGDGSYDDDKALDEAVFFPYDGGLDLDLEDITDNEPLYGV